MNHLKFCPTPIKKMEYYSKKYDCNIICKRDDLGFTEVGGGNKARMMMYLLNDISSKNVDVVVSAGGPNSNFNRVLALMCVQLGIKFHLIEYTDNEADFHTSLNYKLCKLSNMISTRCSKGNVPQTIESVLDNYEKMKIKAKFIYGGGKSLEGYIAFYDAVYELSKQISSNIDHVFIACSTGTTLTGLCAGFQQFLPGTIIHAISTARVWLDEKKVLEDNIKVINTYLNKDYNFSNVLFYENYLCGGYAKYDESIMSVIKECISNEAMIIDPTYSGKAFYGMIDIIKNNSQKFKNQNILFWNTGGMYNLLSEI